MFDNLYSNFSYEDNFQDDVFDEKCCPVCGTPASEILSNENVGCSNCYNYFSNEAKNIIIRKQGTFAHVGKIPIKYFSKQKISDDLKKLEEEKLQAVKNEDFIAAEALKNQIERLKGELK